MTYRLRFEPSGHECAIESSETILDAALRAGLSIRYGCRNGSCGECKGRLIQGSLGACLHRDYPLSEAQKVNNTLLMCRAMVTSDVTVEALEAVDVHDLPVQQITATVSKMDRPTEDVMVLHLRVPRSQTLQFMAGQHVCIGIDGVIVRNKSVASCPCNGMYLQFHIRNVPGDAFARYVFENLKLRQSVQLEGPFGNFILDEHSNRPIVMIAYETGFSPIKSLIEHAISLELTQPIKLYWIARNAKDHYLINYCRAWQDSFDNFSFIPLVSNGQTALASRRLAELGLRMAKLKKSERDLFSAAAYVVGDIPDLRAYDVYVNGPESLLEPTRALLLAHGLLDERLFVDHIRRF